MPLPSGTPLSLQGHSRPGDTVQTKPKHAMIVRMSAETLEALEDLSSNPVMNFEFGDSPGIYIGETFFPMRPLKESSPHEIYLRTSSAAKPNAPLKLYANVMGKFIVDRQLGEKVTDKVRQQTIEAKKQHSERQTIMLDAPLISAASTKNLKRKTPGSGTVVKKTAQRDTLRTPAASTPVTRKISPIPQTASSKANADIRRRLIHFLAVENRETDLTVARVCGNSCDATARANLLSILEEVGMRHSTLTFSLNRECAGRRASPGPERRQVSSKMESQKPYMARSASIRMGDIQTVRADQHCSTRQSRAQFPQDTRV